MTLINTYVKTFYFAKRKKQIANDKEIITAANIQLEKITKPNDETETTHTTSSYFLLQQFQADKDLHEAIEHYLNKSHQEMIITIGTSAVSCVFDTVAALGAGLVPFVVYLIAFNDIENQAILNSSRTVSTFLAIILGMLSVENSRNFWNQLEKENSKVINLIDAFIKAYMKELKFIAAMEKQNNTIETLQKMVELSELWHKSKHSIQKPKYEFDVEKTITPMPI